MSQRSNTRDQDVLGSDDDQNMGDIDKGDIYKDSQPGPSKHYKSDDQTKDVFGKNLDDRIKSSYKNPRKDQGNKSIISNSEIMFAVKSLEGRMRKLEDNQTEIIRLLTVMSQNNPTFLSSGNSGPLSRSTVGGRTKEILN